MSAKGFFQAITRKISAPTFDRFQKLPGKVAEAVREATAEKGLFIPAFKTRLGEQPTVSLATLMEYYLKDPAVMAAVDYISEQMAGVGFYTVCEPGFDEAKRLIDEFCAKVEMDSLLMRTAKEVVLSGNCFWEKIRSTRGPDKGRLVDLKILPLSSIKFIQRDKYGRVQSYIQQIGSEKVEFTADEIIHFCLNPADGSAWGTGILHSLATSKTIDEATVRPALLDIKARLEDDIQRIVHRYAAPKRLWKFEGVGDEKLREEYAPAIQDAPPDADFVTNKPVQVDSLDINPASRFDGFIDYINSQIVQGLQTPMTRLFTTPGFTEASATEATKMADRKIQYLQRFIARIVEREVFAVVLQENGFDPVAAAIRIRWGMQERPEVKIEHIIQLAQISATSGIEYLTRDEVRNMLAKYAGFELQEETAEATAEERLAEALLREAIFYRDEEGRLRVIPEGEDEVREYTARLTHAARLTSNLRGPAKEHFERVLRTYKAEHLEGLKEIKEASPEEYFKIFGATMQEQPGGAWYNPTTREIHLDVKGYFDPTVARGVGPGKYNVGAMLDHEMAHHLLYSVRERAAEKFSWPTGLVITDANEGKIARYISRYATKSTAEATAEAFSLMKRYPSAAREIAKRDPDMARYLEETRNLVGYRMVRLPRPK